MGIPLTAMTRAGAFSGNSFNAGAVTDIADLAVLIAKKIFLFGKVRDGSESGSF